MNGADTSGTINVLNTTTSTTYASSLSLGQISAATAFAPATNNSIAILNGTTQLATANETFVAGDRYLVLAAADPFGANAIVYDYVHNTHPDSSTEWVLVANGIPDFISPLDFYVLGPGKTVATSTPSVSGLSPATGSLVQIPASLGTFTVVVTQQGDKTPIATSAPQTSSGGASIVADFSNGLGTSGYTFLVAREK